jgi:LacI family transcriptional regulator
MARPPKSVTVPRSRRVTRPSIDEQHGSGKGKRAVTITEIAQHAGVSRATVSLVLRESPMVGAATRERVLESIRERGYFYNRAAANLRGRTSKTIGVIVPNLLNPFNAALTAGIDATLDEAGWVAFVANTGDKADRQDRFLRRMREQNVDGIIISHAIGTGPDVISRLQDWRIAIVQTLRCAAKNITDYVNGDYRCGMRLAVEHLLALGHQRIAFIGSNQNNSGYFDRKAGFRSTLRAHRLDDSILLRCPPDRQGGFDCVPALVGHPRAPTAVVCHSDLVATGVMQGLRRHDRVPGTDFAVIGIDGIEEGAFSIPPLTTIAFDPWRLGEDAARLMLARLKNPAAEITTILQKPELVVRESCGENR